MSVSALVEWATGHGAVVDPHVSFERGDFGIGAYYTPEEPAGDAAATAGVSGAATLIELPIALSITPQVAVRELAGYGQHLYDSASNINTVTKMYLARERAPERLSASFFGPYLRLLPPLADISSPYCWRPQDKELLKGTNLGNSLAANLAQLVEEWWQAINMMPDDVARPPQHFVNMKFYYEYKFYTDDDLYGLVQSEDAANWTSFASFLWLLLMLKSRSFPHYLVEPAAKPDEAMLLPLVDLLNHSMSARVEWLCVLQRFRLGAELPHNRNKFEVFNNYGMKGNEELLLAYGFCLPDNVADSAALKIKVLPELLPGLEAQGVRLPQVADYTTLVVRTTQTKSTDHSDGLLFFVTAENVPENLIKLFQCLVRNKWEESGISLRMQLAGINQLRLAIEAKLLVIATAVPESPQRRNIELYLSSQRKVYAGAIKQLKRLEKSILIDQKSRLVTLKQVFKRDIQLQRALLIALGVSSYETVVESQFADQYWLLYLMRCYNRAEYEDDSFLPEWIGAAFARLAAEVEIKPAEVVQYKDIYLGLIPPLAQAVPEIFARGKWRVNEMIVAAKLLDMISFTRGKEHECILVECDAATA